jgi:hypothetical protein
MQIPHIQGPTSNLNRQFGLRASPTIKIRYIWIDDKNDCFVVKLDYLHDNHEESIYDESDIQKLLKSRIVTYQGQPHDIN